MAAVLVYSIGEGTGTGCQTDNTPILALTSSELIDQGQNSRPLVKVDDGKLAKLIRNKNLSGHSLELMSNEPTMNQQLPRMTSSQVNHLES